MAKPYWICPSILSADFANLGEEVNNVVKAGANRIHVDVMDHHYVPNLTVGPMVVDALRKAGIKAPIDVHLMVEPVDDLISLFAQAGSDLLYFHPEASKHIDRSLQLIHSYHCQAGLVFNPATPLNYLDYVWPKLDRVLLMSVNPGFGGQKLIPEVLHKASHLRHLIDRHNDKVRLEIDGGIKIDNIKSIAQYGVDTFVVGSAIFKSDDYRQTISQLKRALV